MTSADIFQAIGTVLPQEYLQAMNILDFIREGMSVGHEFVEVICGKIW